MNKYAVVKFILPILILFFFDGYYDFKIRLLACCSFSFVLHHILKFIKYRNSEIGFYLFPLCLYWIYFQLPFLFNTPIDFGYRYSLDNYLLYFAFLFCICIFLFPLGFKLINKSFIKPISKKTFKFKHFELVFVIKLLSIISILNRFFINLSLHDAIESLIPILSFSPTLLFLTLVLYFWRYKKRSKFFYIGSVIILLEFLFRIAETLYFDILLLFFAGVFIVFLKRSKIPFFTISLAVLLLLPSFSNRKNYRYENVIERWYESKSTNVFSIITDGAGIISSSFDNFGDQISFDEIKSRSELISFFSQVYYKHNISNEMEFHLGKTFWWLPLTPIPRFIIPFKPKNEMAHSVAYEYGLRGNTKGAFNFPILCEGYINFGTLGLFIIILFHGAFLKWAFLKVGSLSGDLNLLIFANISRLLFNIESNITLLFGSILQILLFWYFLILFLRFRYKLKI